MGAVTLLGSAPSIAQTTLTIATVNNGDMIRMQGLTNEFTAKNPDITVKWVTLEENVLRQRVTTDIATKGGQFDVLTIGTYEVPIWAKKNWLIPLDKLGSDYDVADLLPKIRDAVSVIGQALCRAVLRREFDGDVSHRPVPEGRIDDAGKADLGFCDRCGEEAHRQIRWRLRHLPAGQGGLGREHGIPDRDVQFVRRALVRREMAAAVRQAGVEEDAFDLRRPDEGRRPSRRKLERLQ